ncbi:MAG: class I SAM-dependent methyltransferase [Selenomonadaceae bacterium]|nr:class I SAM-dependent methyltransferase [Selenomonadaceae bacterium]
MLEGFFIEVAPTYIWRLDIENSITDADKWNAEENFQSIWGFSPRYSFLLRMEILQLIPDLTRDGIEILEVGCAAGGTLYVLRSENPSAKLYGIEINSGATRIASMFAEVENVDVEKVTPDHWREKFDYIICGDVIEHLVDPWTAIRNMRKMLKPGGHLLASIPNVANIDVVENLLRGFWDYMDAGILDRTHLRFFTMDSIIKIIQSSNFQHLEIIYKRLNFQNHLLPLAEELSARFNVKLEHFMTYQYLVDATK